MAQNAAIIRNAGLNCPVLINSAGKNDYFESLLRYFLCIYANDCARFAHCRRWLAGVA